MNVVSVIILVAITGLTSWLLIDTIIWIVKRSKERKAQKQQEIKEENKVE